MSVSYLFRAFQRMPGVQNELHGVRVPHDAN
jgi:hypothetical protein